MAAFESRLITPPKEEEEIYPYRRVWPSIIIETGILFGIGLALFILTRFISIPPRFYQPANILLALLPVALWLFFSWLRERTVPQPRQQLIAIMIITALAANAIGIPLVEDFLQVDRWLPLESAINRIIGYTFTSGLVQAVIMYLVLRYTVWPGGFRYRLDGVAYGAASAVGYALVFNLRLALASTLSPDVMVFRIFDTVAVQLASSIIIGYGLAEVRFNPRPFPPLLSAITGLAALITGLALPLRTGLTNAGVVQGISATSPIRGYLFSAVLLVGVAAVFAFLFNIATRQDAEAAAQREV